MLPKKCMHCERRFTKAEHLKRHQRSHTGERPYKCIQCSKRFSRSDVLGRHLKNHTQNVVEETEEVLSPVENGQRDRRNSSTATFSQSNMTIDQPSEILEPRSDDMSIPPHVNISSFQDATMRYTDNSPIQPSPSGLDHLATISAQQRQGHGSIDATMAGVPSSIGLSPLNNVDDWNHLDLSVRDAPSQNGITGENVFLSNDSNFNNLATFTNNSAYFQMNSVPDLSLTSSLQNNHIMPSIAELTQENSGAMPDAFQNWFEQYDRDIHAHGGMFGISTPFSSTRVNGIHHAPEARREYRAPSTTSSNDNIPNGRFAKVQQCWPARPSSAIRLMPTLWRDVIAKAEQNLVSETNSPHEVNHTQQYGSRWGLDDDCRDRLLKIFGGGVYFPGRYMYPKAFENPMTSMNTESPAGDNSFHSPESDGIERAHSSANFPPAEILDIGLDLYFRQFHPLMPFIHTATFCPRTARPSMVFAMCLIGLTILNTKGATTFVQRAFPALYEKVSAELIHHASGNCAPLEIMITFANAMLITNLAEITAVEDNQEKAHMLYVNAVAIAQRHGIFTANEGQPLDKSMFDDIADLDQRWKAWSRVESTKRLIMCLAMTDSWFSGSLHVSPLLRTDAIQVLLPCDMTLFQAKSATKWAQLVAKGNPLIMPTLALSSQPTPLPIFHGKVDVFGMQGLLSIIRLRISEAYHRLISGSDRRTVEHSFVPWKTHVGDSRAEHIRAQVVEVGDCYGDILRDMNANCIVLWHNMAIMLTADLRIFELAAGRAGVDPARQALEDICTWSQTPAARRAVVHAAQTFKVMSNRRASDGAMFHSAAGLFASALVLGLYVFMVPSVEGGGEKDDNASDDCEPFELLDDIDWQAVGNAGLVDPADEDMQLRADKDDPAVQFIRKGGKICFSGTVHQPGYQPAKRLLLDYARLLEDIGKWKIGKFSRVLRIMSDALVDVEGQEVDL